MTVYKEPPAKIKNGGATILLFHEDKLAKVALLIVTVQLGVSEFVNVED
jgi:hypothetical protein